MNVPGCSGMQCLVQHSICDEPFGRTPPCQYSNGCRPAMRCNQPCVAGSGQCNAHSNCTCRRSDQVLHPAIGIPLSIVTCGLSCAALGIYKGIKDRKEVKVARVSSDKLAQEASTNLAILNSPYHADAHQGPEFDPSEKYTGTVHIKDGASLAQSAHESKLSPMNAEKAISGLPPPTYRESVNPHPPVKNETLLSYKYHKSLDQNDKDIQDISSEVDELDLM